MQGAETPIPAKLSDVLSGKAALNTQVTGAAGKFLPPSLPRTSPSLAEISSRYLEGDFSFGRSLAILTNSNIFLRSISFEIALEEIIIANPEFSSKVTLERPV